MCTIKTKFTRLITKLHYRLECLIVSVNLELAKIADHIERIHSDGRYRSERVSTINKKNH